MSYLISPQEPANRKALHVEGISSPLCEDNGCDLLAFIGEAKVGAQIKVTPSDFVASLEDGRLQQELPLMAKLDIKVLILEGKMRYMDDRLFIPGRRGFSRYTKSGIRNLMRDFYWQFGVTVEYSGDMQETLTIWYELMSYPSKVHSSLFTRPKPQGEWGYPSPGEQLAWFYQGIPGVGPRIASAIAEVFPTPDSLLQRDADQLISVRRVGKPTAEMIDTFLRQGHTSQ